MTTAPSALTEANRQTLYVSDVETGARPSLVGIANILLQRRASIAIAVGVVLGLVVAATLLRARTYTSHATFMPQSRNTQSGLSGLAAQLGLALPSGDPSQQPAFYVDLVQSREVLRAVAQATYQVPQSPDGRVDTLLNIYGIRSTTAARRLELGIKRLRDAIQSEVGPKTGVVKLAVRARDAIVAQQIASHLLEELNRFNLQTRQSQAAAERLFTENRLSEIETQLRAAEDALQRFLERNRDYRNSPLLQFQHDRLERDVQMRQQVYTTLAQAFEEAKIEEVRDTPVLTVIEPPSIALEPDHRGLLIGAVLAIIGALFLSSLWIVGLEFLRLTQAPYEDELRRFAVLKREALADLRNPLRLLRGGHR